MGARLLCYIAVIAPSSVPEPPRIESCPKSLTGANWWELGEWRGERRCARRGRVFGPTSRCHRKLCLIAGASHYVPKCGGRRQWELSKAAPSRQLGGPLCATAGAVVRSTNLTCTMIALQASLRRSISLQAAVRKSRIRHTGTAVARVDRVQGPCALSIKPQQSSAWRK